MKFRLSFRIRWVMVMIAILGLVAGTELTRRRWDRYREMATAHARAEETQRFLLGGGVIASQVGVKVVTLMGPSTEQIPMNGSYTGFIETESIDPSLQRSYLRRRVDYHAGLRSKYERAASRPWLAVEPDPPVPKPSEHD